MPYDLIYSLLSDPQSRQGLAVAIDDFASGHPQDPDLGELFELRNQIGDGYYFMPLSLEQITVLEKVVVSNSFSQSAARFASEPPTLPTTPQPQFVPREEDDDLRHFLKHMPFQFTQELVDDFNEANQINLETVRRWGSQNPGNGFVEPQKHNLDRVLKVYEWLDKKAREYGMRVDLWDYLASIYPPVREMLKDSASTGGEIVVRVPKFMEKRSFDQFNYATFALDAHLAGLVPEIPETTRASHIRSLHNGNGDDNETNVIRPQWETLNNYARYATEKADGDDVHRQQMLNFLTLLRFLPILRNTVPALNVNDHPLTTPDNGHPTRFTLRVVPEDEVVQYIPYGRTVKFSAQRWPFSEIASGLFDRMIGMLEDRISTMREFSSMLENDSSSLESLESKLQEFRIRHASYKEALSSRDPSSPMVTDGFADEAKPFYRDLGRFFEQTLFHTHARGSVSLGNLSIPFEIVPEISGVDVAPAAGGRVSVIAEDIALKADAENWPAEMEKDVFNLRVFMAWQIASGLLDPGTLEDPQKIIDAANHFGPIFDSERLEASANILVGLNSEAKERRAAAIDPTLHRALRLRTIGTSHLRDYYVYDYSTPWQERMAQHYSQNHDSAQVDQDAQITENYFKSVRHPHFIYNPAKLNAAIAKVYETDAERQFALARLLGFFETINIRTDSTPIRPLSADEAEPETRAIEWAFQDYLALFPGAAEFEAKIEINEALLAEVVDRQIAEHPGAHLRRGIIKRGVLAAINKFNEGRSSPFSEITADFNPLPDQGIFPEHFYDFVSSWGADHNMAFFLNEEKLLAAFSFLKNSGLSREGIDVALLQVGLDQGYLDVNERLLFDYLVNTEHEMNMFERLASPDRVRNYLNNNYNAPLISAEAASAIISEYLKGRLTSPYPVDLNGLIVEEIGDRFDPYPTIKAEVVAFYHMLVREYLHDTFKNMQNAHDSAIQAIDDNAAEFLNDGGKMFYGMGLDLGKAALFAINPVLMEGRGIPDAQLNLFGNEKHQIEAIRAEHPDYGTIKRFDSQLYLLAEALGEPPPSVGIEEYLTETDEAVNEKVELLRQNARDSVRSDEYALIASLNAISAFAKSVELFAKEFEPSDSTLSKIDTMDIGQIDAATANILRGLEIATGLEAQLDGPILYAKKRAVDLAKKLGEDDDASDIFNTARETLTRVVSRLNEEGILLEMRKEDINRAEARDRADTQASHAISGATDLLSDTGTLGDDIGRASAEINALREEIRSYRDLEMPGTSNNISSYLAAWTKIEAFRNRADELRRRLNGLRTRADSLSPGGVLAALAQVNGVSDGMRDRLSTERKNIVRAISDTRVRLEEAEGFITQLGGTITSTETRLVRAEENIPVPAAFELPQGIEVSGSEIADVDNSIVLFNTADTPKKDPSDRLSQIRQAIGRLELLVAGERAYIVSKPTADNVRGWLANRTTPIQIIDIFGETLSINAGTRGIRIVSGSQDSDALLTFRIKLNILLSVNKSYEADFIVKLFGKAQNESSNPEAGALWRRLLAEIAGADILSEDDAKIFIRRFAITHGEEVEEIGFPEDLVANWFVEAPAPLQIELTNEQIEELERNPIEDVAKEVGITGWANQQDKEAHLRSLKKELSEAIKPYLTFSVRQWWVAHENEIPDKLAMVWYLAHQANRPDILKGIFIDGLSSYLESRRQKGGGSLTIPMEETLRYARLFNMEYWAEIRFHHVLYKNGELLHDFGAQRRNAQLYKMYDEHPELQTIMTRRNGANGPEATNYFISQSDVDRFNAAIRAGQDEITVSSYNYLNEAFEDETIKLAGFKPQDLPTTDERDPISFTHILNLIYNEPELLALGFMVKRIIKERVTDAIGAKRYEHFWELLGEYDRAIQNQPDPLKQIEILADLESDVFRLYNSSPRVYNVFRTVRNAIEKGIETFMGEAWQILSMDKRRVYLNQRAHAVTPRLSGEYDEEITGLSVEDDQAIYSIETGDMEEYFEDPNVGILPGNIIPVEIPMAEFLP